MYDSLKDKLVLYIEDKLDVLKNTSIFQRRYLGVLYSAFFLTSCFLTSAVFSEIKPLFYKAYNFAENDVLNVRQKPDFQSNKIGELALGRHFSVGQCLENGIKKKSKWCKVKPLDYGGNEAEGWVNAKYITPTLYQEGYVTIKNRKSICDYVLKCESRENKPQCLVVTGLTDNKEITLQTEWVDYPLLQPASNFSAADDEDLNPEGDYCVRGRYVDEYFKNKKIKALSAQFPEPEFQTVLALLKALNNNIETDIEALIHPKNGITLSELSYFNKKGSKWVLKNSFLERYRSRVKLDWGQSEAKGDSIKKDLYAYFEDLPKDIPHIKDVRVLNNFKNFPRGKGQKLKAYGVYWDQGNKNKIYEYMGLVIILEAYQGEWTVVGISKDYWTP